MALIDISAFQGAKPVLEPHLLQPGEAHDAINCRILSGGLAPFEGATQVQALTLAGAQTIARFGQTSYWFEFAGDVDCWEGPVPSDTESTTYFTGDGVPAMTYASIATSGSGTYPSNRYALGIPAPTTSMNATVTGTADPNDLNPESRAYVFTYVSARGEEGPPSLPTSIVDVYLNQSVALSSIPTVPTGNYQIATKRIYRTASATGDTQYQFVAEIPASQTTYTDSIATSALGEVLPSSSWYPPPSAMIGLTKCENGVFAGFDGKTLCLSYPYLPHAWPPEYQITTNEPIVGLTAIQGGLIVSTTGRPEIVLFTDPAAASRTIIDQTRPCVSKRSMVDMGQYAVYASPDGLVSVNTGGSASLITYNVIDPYVWRTLSPSTMRGYRLYDWYVCFYDNGTTQGGFIITAQGGQFSWLDFYADAGYSDPQTGRLYLVINNNIVEWDQDTANLLTYQWTSGDFLTGRLANAGAARVDAESYPGSHDTTLVFELFADGASVYSLQVTSAEPFRLPGNYLARRFAVKLSGTRTVRRVLIGETVEEVA